MIKGTKMSKESRLKVSLGLKKYYKKNDVWNKGVHNPKYNEPASVRFRRDKKYYLNELKNNAIRRKKLGYDKDEKKIEETKERQKFYKKVTGTGRPSKQWSKEDVSFLKENYKMNRLFLCKELNRSWSSVQHKVSRLGLQKYNRWTT